jgi:hypothetical protein
MCCANETPKRAVIDQTTPNAQIKECALRADTKGHSELTPREYAPASFSRISRRSRASLVRYQQNTQNQRDLV